MGVTAAWGIPFAEVFDPPHGPDQEEALAVATDAALTIVANAASAADAKAVRSQVRTFTARLAAAAPVGGEGDVAGCSVTFNTANPNTEVLVAYGIRVSGMPTGHYIQGKINVDGVNRIEDIFAGQNGSLGPGMASLTFGFTLPAAGPHVIKIRAVSSNGGSVEANTTGLTVAVLGA